MRRFAGVWLVLLGSAVICPTAHAAAPLPFGQYVGVTAQRFEDLRFEVDLQVRDDGRAFEAPSQILGAGCADPVPRGLGWFPGEGIGRERPELRIDRSGRFRDRVRAPYNGYGRRAWGAVLVVTGRFERGGRAVRGTLLYIGANGCRERIAFSARLRPEPGVRPPAHGCSRPEILTKVALRAVVAGVSCADADRVLRRLAGREDCRVRPCSVAGWRCRPVTRGLVDRTARVSCGTPSNVRGTIEIVLLRYCGKYNHRLATAINTSCTSARRLVFDFFGCRSKVVGDRCRVGRYTCEIRRHHLGDNRVFWCTRKERPGAAVAVTESCAP